jgi:hypothetical protein
MQMVREPWAAEGARLTQIGLPLHFRHESFKLELMFTDLARPVSISPFAILAAGAGLAVAVVQEQRWPPLELGQPPVQRWPQPEAATVTVLAGAGCHRIPNTCKNQHGQDKCTLSQALR